MAPRKARAAKEPAVIDHPRHYNEGKIEVIDFIEDQRFNFHLGNSVKYICRAGRKQQSSYTEDLQKAIWYLEREIERYKEEEEQA